MEQLPLEFDFNEKMTRRDGCGTCAWNGAMGCNHSVNARYCLWQPHAYLKPRNGCHTTAFYHFWKARIR